MSLLVSCSLPTNSNYVDEYDTSQLKSGDIILRKSYSFISDIIVAQLNDTIDVSHCGIIVKDSSSNFMVIHTLSKQISDFDGIQICTLADFMEDSRIETVRILRFKNDTTSQIVKSAFYYLRKRIPFDNSFDLNDSTAFFCSELPIHIIRNCFKINLCPELTNPKFSCFLNEKYFNEITFKK